ncbi:hypothetical protein CBS63078_8537 [Aspergillus niger]|uniref:Sugar phosphate phosphatase n=1 Tax=Aspergillus niger TaxID=5061 RepID=A0A505IK94_ASPNG|nr:hypothetical protein CBS63078_8537 [Aspergillus niger]KAI2963690.1 hypothetical protein CBS147323_6640 [Aspergillus niger]KAI3016260.1 hypothetical protein CBS147345_4719 [Aspergillus niger]KAI3026920.1 hypothetical protein CBS147347_4756 [Aspergillus niger]KAI3086066.1 hypothetical protein CBS147353_1253 [Aspergillus niger]
MEFDPSIPGYSTSDESSFAFISAHERWPIILDGIIADVSETLSSTKNSDARAEGLKIIQGFQALKAEIQSDAKLLPLEIDGSTEIVDYNKELAQRKPTWFNVFWLYGECYLYRRIDSLFSQSINWKGYDVFARQKKSTFQSSKTAIVELAARYKTVLSTAALKDSTVEAFHFKEMCEICLWGNATDLSLLTSLTYEDIQKLQGAEARKSQEKNVLINDIPVVYDVMNKVRQDKGAGGRVDIVLDNSGFELYVDLLLAAFMLSTGLASKVLLHPKSLPWFVSDVVPADFTDLLMAVSEPESFFGGDIKNKEQETGTVLKEHEKGGLDFLCAQWNAFRKSGKLIVQENPFWITANSYWRLPYIAPGLFGELRESDLVIFKGDLNYRKLTGDVKWDPTTSFSEAIGPLGQGSGVRTLALRTCKADVVVGLAEGQDEGLRNAHHSESAPKERRWAWTGKWAVASFYDGKSIEN